MIKETQVEMARLREEMDGIRREVGTYSMMTLRGIFPPDEGPLWGAMEGAIAARMQEPHGGERNLRPGLAQGSDGDGVERDDDERGNDEARKGGLPLRRAAIRREKGVGQGDNCISQEVGEEQAQETFLLPGAQRPDRNPRDQCKAEKRSGKDCGRYCRHGPT